MWQCKVCEADVEDDSWDTCWRCSSDRSLEGLALEERKNAVMQKKSPAIPLSCLRCKSSMEYCGTKKFHEGGNTWFSFGWNYDEAANREHYDVYACPNCGKLEFFLDGVGDVMRGEQQDPETP